MNHRWVASWLLATASSLLSTLSAAAPDLRGVSYDQRLGNRLPLQTVWRDEQGRSVQLSQLMDGTPLILDLGYFNCPALCSIARADMFRALGQSGLKAGRDYTFITVSIDPAETAAQAAATKAQDIARFPDAGAREGWHFLVGPAAAIHGVVDAVGFHYRYDPQLHQFIHPAGIVVTTPTGVVSSYLLGLGYQAAAVRQAISRADRGSVARAAAPVLLLCFHFDATTGRYTLVIMKLLRLAGILTLLTIGAVIWLAQRSGGRSR